MPQRKHRRRRRRLNPRFVFLLCTLALLLFLMIWGIASCGANKPETKPQDTTPSDTQNTTIHGWRQEDGKLFYIKGDGTRATGWLEMDGKKYLLDEEGYAKIGWIEDNGKTYYMTADGSMATGNVQIDGKEYHFTSTGDQVLLVNPWNPVPEGYTPDLVGLSTDISVEGAQVDRSCYEALLEMIKDCNQAAPRLCVVSGYRTHEYQTDSYNRKVQSYLNEGYSQADAEKEAATIVAKPGTSEHQLGLAVDIIDTRLWALEEEQATLPAQKWLMEHSWEYGFVLRYPKGKIDVTGIIYEPWHYRYVGKELAKELHDLDLTLEEYLDRLS